MAKYHTRGDVLLDGCILRQDVKDIMAMNSHQHGVDDSPAHYMLGGSTCSVIMEGRWMCLFSDNWRGDGCACSVITGGEMDVPVQ